jgi:superfamily I DNA and/or RNA helicase
LQLSQVAQADHPDGSGSSVLEHILGEHATIVPTEGVFISETRRMHPDVCSFISSQIYEGRLTSHPSCAQQSTAFGTGLRWIEAHHADRSTESPEEADLVAMKISEMIGSEWTDQRGQARALDAADFMVVAPYNDQVRLLRERFLATLGIEGVQVGTVDKFQGREAPVVFFTMTTSTSEDMPRGPEFLFSRNRLNVAVSRARCLAFLVCTEELLNSRARTIDEMRLIGTLSSFVEFATANVVAGSTGA